MKYKHRALALILSIAMMLTFMPAMTFAEDAAEAAEQPVAAEEVATEEAASAEEAAPAEEAVPTEEAVPAEETVPAEEVAEGAEEESLETAEDMEAAAVYPKAIAFSGAIEGYVGDLNADIDTLYEEGNSITITYSDNYKKTFKYDYGDGAAGIEDGFYLDGNNKAERLDYYSLDVEPDERLVKGENNGYIILWYNENDSVRERVTIEGIESDEFKSITYTQKKPITVSYSDRWDWNLEENFEGDILTTSNVYGENIKYVNTAYYDEEFEETFYRYEGTVGDEEDSWTVDIVPSYVPDEDPADWLPGSTHTVYVYNYGVKASGSIKVIVEKVAKPTKVEIVQTAPAQALIGQNYVYVEELYSDGNKIVVTYDDNTVQEYVYQRYENDESDYAFYYIDEDGDYRSFWEEIALDSHVKKGESTVSGKVTVPWDGPTEVRLPVTVKVSAAQYLAQVTYKAYQYTGKKITPKVTVKYWTGKKFKTMSKKWYTCKPKKNKKIGGYTFQVKIKKKYQSKYGKVLYGGYEIIPKKPTISKAKAGTGSITVSWKKFSKKDQKTISGFIVQYSTSKKFPYQDTEWEWVENKKASSCTINGLEAGKKYYVRVCSYTEKGKGDGSSLYQSNPSKSKNATVK